MFQLRTRFLALFFLAAVITATLAACAAKQGEASGTDSAWDLANARLYFTLSS